MISAKQLFITRLKSEWKFQYRVWNLAVDWTVALYIVIPFMLAFVRYYLFWWDKQFSWASSLPFTVFILIFFIYSYGGVIRIFFEEGDQLFLVQRNDWMQRIKKTGIMYSFIQNFALSVGFIILVLPFLIFLYNLSYIQIIKLFIFLLLFRQSITFTKRSLFIKYSGWKYTVIHAVLFLILGVYFIMICHILIKDFFIFISSCLLLITFLGIWTRNYMRQENAFQSEVTYEGMQKIKYISSLLGSAGIIEKKKRIQTKRPILFSKSNHLFKQRTTVNILAEMIVKSFFRNSGNLKLYFQFVVIGVFAIISTPFWFRWVLWILLALLLISWIKSYRREIFLSPFISMYKWKYQDLIASNRKSVFLLVLPGFLILSLFLGAMSFHGFGVIFVIPLSLVIGYVGTRLLTRY